MGRVLIDQEDILTNAVATLEPLLAAEPVDLDAQQIAAMLCLSDLLPSDIRYRVMRTALESYLASIDFSPPGDVELEYYYSGEDLEIPHLPDEDAVIT